MTTVNMNIEQISIDTLSTLAFQNFSKKQSRYSDPAYKARWNEHKRQRYATDAGEREKIKNRNREYLKTITEEQRERNREHVRQWRKRMRETMTEEQREAHRLKERVKRARYQLAKKSRPLLPFPPAFPPISYSSNTLPPVPPPLPPPLLPLPSVRSQK